MMTSTTCTARSYRSSRRIAGLLVLALASACSSGGGGGGGGGGTDPGPDGGDLNEGSYTVDDFDYVDQNPPGYHPLGSDGFRALDREELFAIYPGPDGTGRGFVAQEGPDAGHAALPGVAALFQGQDPVHGAASGQLDGDAETELVVATIDAADSRIGLHRVERSPAGDYQRTALLSIDADGWPFVDAKVTLGDLDGDLRDEIVVTARSARFQRSGTHGRVWVFDDPQDGAAELFRFSRDAGHIDLSGLLIDVDGDDEKELAIGMSGDTSDSGRYVVRLYDLDETGTGLKQLHGWIYLYVANDKDNSRAVVGDFDSDGREDLAWIGYERSNFTELSIQLFEFVEGTWEKYTSFGLIDVSRPSYPAGSWAATAFQPSRGRTDLAIANPSTGAYDYVALHYNRDMKNWSSERGRIDRYAGGQGIALAASDVDADGADEVQVGLAHYGFGTGTLNLGHLEHDDSVELVWQPPITLGSAPVVSGVPPVPVLAAGDVDADGFALESTGRRSTRLADPIPLVLLAAPPTVAGISQNYDDTESAYSIGTRQGESMSVSTYTSMTYSVGAGFDLFGLVGVSGRASLEKGVERTSTTTSQETVVSGYRGAYDSDVIVFQGTLYETFEYVIVGAADPEAIGSFVTLDVPCDALTYKWTVDYYNGRVAPEDRIEPDLLTHTPGAIDTYPTRNGLRDLMTGEMHWDLADARRVGQGGASDFQSVSFETEQASEVQRSVTKSYGGGASFGIEVGVDTATTEGSTHGVFYALETTFEASVGDIADTGEYESSRYDWGFSIHTVGRLADVGNQPDGYSQRKHSFQYLRYWAEPAGSSD